MARFLFQTGMAIGLLLSLGACGVTDATQPMQSAAPAAVGSPQSVTPAVQPVTATREVTQMQPKQTPAGSQSTQAPEPTPAVQQSTGIPVQSSASPASRTLSQPETEELVKNHLATILNVPVEQIQVMSATLRTWEDQGLGCSRKGLYEAKPTPGYEFVLTHAGQTFRYHTDRQGRLVRCLEANKPIGPISR
jgi:hypothetical protein